jgi:hypothetical protein
VTYRHDMHHLAVTLARLLHTGDTIAAADLDIAVGAHTATVALLRQVHGDVTGTGQRAGPLHIAEAERHPVGLLGRLLADVPHLSDAAPSQVLATTPVSAVGEQWKAVARSATLAAAGWQSIPATHRPAGDAAWAELADVASLTQGLLAASDDLADSLARAGRDPAAQALRQVGRSGLGVAAEQTRRLAVTGPLLPGPDHVRPPSRRPVAVRSCEDLPEAFRRLTHLIRSAGAISPRDVDVIAQTVAAAAHLGSRVLDMHGDTAAAAVLRRHADLLSRATDTTRRLATIEPLDRGPVIQAQAIHQHLAAARRRHELPDPGTVQAYAAELADVTTALNDATHREIRRGAWLTPSEHSALDRPHWIPANQTDHAPRIAARLQEAATHITSPDAHRVLQRPGQARGMPTPPREVLAAAVGQRTLWSLGHRPRAPGHRLGPTPGRAR